MLDYVALWGWSLIVVNLICCYMVTAYCQTGTRGQKNNPSFTQLWKCFQKLPDEMCPCPSIPVQDPIDCGTGYSHLARKLGFCQVVFGHISRELC